MGDKINKSIETVNAAQTIGEQQIIDNVDYDDAVQMPFAQGTLIEQFEKYGHLTPMTSGDNMLYATPEKTPNIFLNPSLQDVFNDLSASINHTLHKRSRSFIGLTH